MKTYRVSKKPVFSKIESNKSKKLNKLLDTAFQLFTYQGILHTSIQDIVDKAGVAKGTFYLYFKDKYEIQDHLLVRTSYRLFKDAHQACEQSNIQRLDDKIIFVIDYIIDYLIQHPTVLNFIKKNLSLGLYSEKLSELIEDDHLGLKEIFLEEVKQRNLALSHPEVTLYMIIELAGSTLFSSIVKSEPVGIEEYKPILYDTIRKMINEK